MKTLYVQKKGTVVIGVLQWIFYILAFICLVIGVYALIDEETEMGLIFLGVMLLCYLIGVSTLPFKSIVKAADYYIATIENNYDIVNGKITQEIKDFKEENNV